LSFFSEAQRACRPLLHRQIPPPHSLCNLLAHECIEIEAIGIASGVTEHAERGVMQVEVADRSAQRRFFT
jgi:hypothetical protein